MIREKRIKGREIRKTRRAFMRMGMSFEAAGKAAHRAARTMVKVVASFKDAARPTVAELNAGTPLNGVHWLGFDSVEP